MSVFMCWRGLGLGYSFYLALTCVAPSGLGTGRKNQGHSKAHMQLLPTEAPCLILSIIWFDSVCGYWYVSGVGDTQGGHQLYPERLQHRGPLESSSPLSPAGLLPIFHTPNLFSGLNSRTPGLSMAWETLELLLESQELLLSPSPKTMEN